MLSEPPAWAVAFDEAKMDCFATPTGAAKDGVPPMDALPYHVEHSCPHPLGHLGRVHRDERW